MTLATGHPLYDEAFAKARRDVTGNIVDGRLIAGQTWPQIWTRDSSYALDLGTGLGVPGVGMTTLRTMTTTDRLGEVWRQDPCRHFGAWPNLTDSIVGAVGAWATYLAGGDEDFLRWSFDVTRNSLARAERDAFDVGSGLFRGCASFMESNSGYPLRFRYRGTAVGRTKALSTNLLYFRGYQLAARMAGLIGEDGSSFADRATALREAVNRRLWSPARGLYAYYETESGRQSRRMEGLGEALAVLWGVADQSQAKEIFKNVSITGYGIPCLWPRYLAWRYYFNDANYYHNGMVWPFVQGYWAQAAAGRGAVDVFDAELAKLARSAQRSATFYEFYRPGNGQPDGSPRQLWSAAGYLSMIHHGLLGMSFDEEHVTFRPVVPAQFGRIKLDGFAYRDMVLDVEVVGAGTEVASVSVDGQPQPDHTLPIRTSGRRMVTVVMAAA